MHTYAAPYPLPIHMRHRTDYKPRNGEPKIHTRLKKKMRAQEMAVFASRVLALMAGAGCKSIVWITC